MVRIIWEHGCTTEQAIHRNQVAWARFGNTLDAWRKSERINAFVVGVFSVFALFVALGPQKPTGGRCQRAGRMHAGFFESFMFGATSAQSERAEWERVGAVSEDQSLRAERDALKEKLANTTRQLQVESKQFMGCRGSLDNDNQSGQPPVDQVQTPQIAR